MEMAQGNSLYSYLKQIKMLFHFSFTKQEGRTGPVWGFGTSGRGEVAGKVRRRVNMVQILCTHVCKWKMYACGNYSRNGKRIKENEGGDELNYAIFDIL
jgi:hypothetical protein